VERPGKNVFQLDRLAGGRRGETDSRLVGHASPVNSPHAQAVAVEPNLYVPRVLAIPGVGTCGTGTGYQRG